MGVKPEDVEAMLEILQDNQLHVSDQTAKNIAVSFKDHIDICNEIQLNGIIDKNKKCQKCDQFESEIKKLKNDIDAFKDSVKKRTGAVSVYVENGKVLYDLR